MRWYPSGKLKVTEADLALLSSARFREKAWAKPEYWLRENNPYPPIPSAVFFTLQSCHGETNRSVLWRKYSTLLAVSNDPGAYYRRHTIETRGKARAVAEPPSFCR